MGGEKNKTHYILEKLLRITSKSVIGRTLISHEYDKNGNKIKEIDVIGKVDEFTYNEIDLFEDVIYNGNSIAKHDYYNNGLVKHLKSDSLEQSYNYDEDLNLTNLDIYHNGKYIVDNSYFYDSNGNRIIKFETNGVIIKYVYN